MNISELIHELEKLQKEYGDIEVRLQCQDQGGMYEGNLEVTGIEAEFDKTVAENKLNVVIY